MEDATVLSRLRRFLLGTSALLLAGALVELWLVGHDETATQLIPFALCGLGLIAAVAALARPGRAALLALRACMALVALGSLYGVYEHVVENVAFQREIVPGSTTAELVSAALAGANPLLAPGILALAAALAAASTYYHPALGKGRGQTAG
ncbi:MAG TPA: hypothetical protein VN228_03050 [Pyrinomonadaceae bacterium]|nr:hypothetical protein [Pyrinomonadaceae bacterium]